MLRVLQYTVQRLSFHRCICQSIFPR